MPLLDKKESADQAGFRPRRATINHFFTIAVLQETAEEYQVPLWAVAVDFQKAFDSVTHRSIWDALIDQGVEEGYIQVLQDLYRDQTASVRTDCSSKTFQIQRGTKQGDPPQFAFVQLCCGVHH